MITWIGALLEDVHNLCNLLLLGATQIYGRLAAEVDWRCRELRPSSVILATLLSLALAELVLSRGRQLAGALTVSNVLRRVRSLPLLRGYVEKELAKIGGELRAELSAVYQSDEFKSCLPKRSASFESVAKRLNHYKLFDSPTWRQGRLSGAVYIGSQPEKYNELMALAYRENMWTNPLHSDVFAGVRKMEGEIVRMTATMFNGDPNKVRGSVTSGGTESIILACKAYRDYALNVRGIRGQPEMVVPRTAHAAFEKAARLLQMRVRFVPVNAKTFKVDMAAMRRAVGRNTCMLVGSAPGFPHGVLDPIAEIAKLGEARAIPVHVDACLGGFLIAFMKLAEFPLDERFDFGLPGVTSISADTHKYAYAPKGTSVLLYADKKFIHQQYSVQTDWPGGVYASASLPGSRPGGLIAACWAAMMYHGLDGYVAATARVIATSRKIEAALREIEGLRVLGNPLVSVIAFTSDRFDVYALNQRLRELGWNLNVLQFPAAIHLCVTLMHTNAQVAESFVGDVRRQSALLLAEPAAKATGSAAVYGMSQTLPDRSLVAEVCGHYLDACLGY